MLVTALALVVPASSASAASAHDVANEAELRAAISAAVAGDTIRLTDNIGSETARVSWLGFRASGTLDLNGHMLVSDSIGLASGIEFVIDDRSAAGAGGINAVYKSDSAAISPFLNIAAISASGSMLTIAGGNITATTNEQMQNAGIGGVAPGNAGAQAGQGIYITGGTVTATAYAGAGIGLTKNEITKGDYPITITGGTVTATSVEGAGIGGPSGNTPGGKPVINISGGTVTAHSDTGAGIGGGAYTGVLSGTWIAPITISGTAVVQATSRNAAGIGGGTNGRASSLLIDVGADVTASSGNPLVPAIGAGPGTSGEGALTVNGTLHLPAGTFLRSLVANPVGSVVNTVGETGKIVGEGELRAQGVWNNHGAITLPDTAVKAKDVNDHHFRVKFNSDLGVKPSDVRVFAGSFSAGDRMLPIMPTTDAWLFAGWNTAADGTGTLFDADTVMTAKPEVGGVDGTEVQLYAQWAPSRIVVTATPAVEQVGNEVTLSAECFGVGDVSLGDCTADTVFASDGEGDQVAGNKLTGTQAGNRTITAQGWGLTGTTIVELEAGPAVGFLLTPELSRVQAGDTVTFTAVLIDAYGNRTVANESDVTLSTNAPKAVVNGHRITFPKTGEFTVTGHFGDQQQEVAVAVTSAPVVPATPDKPAVPSTDTSKLANTGATGSVVVWGALAALMLLGGALAIQSARRARP